MPKIIRRPAVAGQFYPADEGELREIIDRYLENAETPQPPFIRGATPPNPPLRKGRVISTLLVKGGEGGFKGVEVMAVIVPHAGYVFSGSVAAYAYKELKGRKIKTAVLVGNAHSAYFQGIAVDDSDVWQTPLGLVEVDKNFAEKLMRADKAISFNGEAHQNEHSLEVQLPFLQTVLTTGFKIVPILFGNEAEPSSESSELGSLSGKLARALPIILREDDLVVISSDMSHYPSYKDAERIDNQTLELIKTGDMAGLERHISEVENENVPNEQTLLCGIDGVKTIMELANIMGWQAEILKYANSGDSSYGDKESVVGYGAVAYAKIKNKKSKIKSNELLNSEQRKTLVRIVKESVEDYIKTGKAPEFEISDERLNWKEGAFVTLKKNGELRGCIGQIIPGDKPLWQVVRDMAIAAAIEDDRFSPVSADEFSDLEYEISVLSKPEKIDNWQDIELGKHGIIIRKGVNGGVFLPQVARETGWSKEEFLSQLCYQKAGLPPDSYKDGSVEIKVFTAQVF
jgi:AmmeMemoRadiSam system protein B/AmmeMemoRadiSam system protein A